MALRLFNELHQAAQPLADILQDRGGDVLPELVGLHFNDQLELRPDHRNAGLFLQGACNLTHVPAPPRKRFFVPQQAELQAQNEEVKLLGFLVIVHQLRRQARHVINQLAPFVLTQDLPGFCVGILFHELALGPHNEVLQVHFLDF